VNEIEGEAMPAKKDQRPTPLTRPERGDPVEKSGAGGNPGRSYSQKYSAKPGEERHIIVGMRVGCGKTDPPPDRVVEEGRAQIIRRCYDKGRDDDGQPGRYAQEQQPEHARLRNLVQNAEKDEAARDREPGDDRDRRGRRRDHYKAAA